MDPSQTSSIRLAVMRLGLLEQLKLLVKKKKRNKEMAKESVAAQF